MQEYISPQAHLRYMCLLSEYIACMILYSQILR